MISAAVLLAAGKGMRYHAAKQDEVFCGKPLWRYAYEAVSGVVASDHIVVVGKDIPGGSTRSGSVRNGLEAARPLVTKEQIVELLECDYPSATFVRPLVNTVIYRNGTYLNRNELYDLLTPQAFDYQLLLEAYQKGNFGDVTDETRIMYEYHGIKPHFIETGSNLFKVTYPGDMEIIKSIYKRQMET